MDDERYDEGTDPTWADLPGTLAGASAPPRRRTGAARIIAPLVLGAAGILLIVAVVTAISTLRAPLPPSATLAPAVAAAAPPSATSPGSVAAGTATTSRSDSTTATSASQSPSASRSTEPSNAAAELRQIAADHERRPQGQVYAVLFDLTEGAENPRLKTESGSTTWQAEDILWLYRQRTSAWPGAVLQAHADGEKSAWRLTVSNPQWRTSSDAQKWCEASFAQYDGADRESRCRVPQR